MGEISGERSNSETDKVDPAAKRKLRGVFLILVSVCIAAYFIGSVVYDEFRLRNAKRSYEVYTAELKQLDQDRMQLEHAADQAKEDKKVIWHALRQGRDLDDIPDFQSNQIVSYPHGNDLSGYLPRGKHDLIITAQWKPDDAWADALNDSLNDAVAEPSTKAFEGEQSWTVPIVGGSKFHFQLSGVRSFDQKDGIPIAWKLDCNQDNFKPRSETIPIDSFSLNRWSISGDIQNLFVPNQAPRNFAFQTQKAAVESPKLIFQKKLRGKCNKIEHTIEFKVHVRSDGPAYVSAATAASLIQQDKEELLMPYQSDGVYQLRTERLPIP